MRAPDNGSRSLLSAGAGGAGRGDRDRRAGDRRRRLAEHAAGARTARDARHAVGKRREPVVGARLAAARPLLGARHGAVAGAHRAGEDSRHLSGSSSSAIRIRARSASRSRSPRSRGRSGPPTAHHAQSAHPSIRDLWLLAGVAAFCVHAYATLSAQVHENHLFAAVPLLVLAAAGRRAFLPIAIGVSAIVALNLNLFYGFGDGIGFALPRAITMIDAHRARRARSTAFCFYGTRRFLGSECSTAAARRRHASASVDAEHRQRVAAGQDAVLEQGAAGELEVQRHEEGDEREERRPEAGDQRDAGGDLAERHQRARRTRAYGIATRSRYSVAPRAGRHAPAPSRRAVRPAATGR